MEIWRDDTSLCSLTKILDNPSIDCQEMISGEKLQSCKLTRLSEITILILNKRKKCIHAKREEEP